MSAFHFSTAAIVAIAFLTAPTVGDLPSGGNPAPSAEIVNETASEGINAETEQSGTTPNPADASRAASSLFSQVDAASPAIPSALAADLASGISGTVNWKIDASGVLTFSPGTFAADLMEQVPWNHYYGQITAAVFTGPEKTVFPSDSSGMFAHLQNMRSFTGTENADTSNVITMQNMFASSDLTYLDLSSWDTGKVTNMAGIFIGAYELESIDFANWNTENVTTMKGLFSTAHKLKYVDLSGWDTRNVTDMSVMFNDAWGLTNVEFGDWETDSVTDMQRMFFGARSLTSLDTSKWNTSEVVNMSFLFNNTFKLQSIDVSNWQTGNVVNMLGMFNSASRVETLDVSKWDTKKVETMDSMFYGASRLRTLDVSSWNTEKLTDIGYMFRDASNLEFLDVSGWDTSDVTDMRGAFAGAANLNGLDLSGWNSSQVTDMREMFGGAATLTNLDLSNFDTALVSDVAFMFSGASSLKTLDLSGWDLRLAYDMTELFSGATSLEYLDLSGWKTTDFPYRDLMFEGVDSLKVLGLGEETLLDEVPEPAGSTGKWIHIGSGTIEIPGISPWGGTGVQLAELTNSGSAAGMYVAQQDLAVTFDANAPSATGTVGSLTGLTGESVPVAENTYVLDKHTFAGWNTKKDGTGTSYESGKPGLFPGGTTVLFAQWEADPQPIIDPTHQPTFSPSAKPTARPNSKPKELALTGTTSTAGLAWALALIAVGSALIATSKKRNS